MPAASNGRNDGTGSEFAFASQGKEVRIQQSQTDLSGFIVRSLKPATLGREKSMRRCTKALFTRETRDTRQRIPSESDEPDSPLDGMPAGTMHNQAVF